MITVNYKLVTSPFLGGEALIATGIGGSADGIAAFCFDGIKSGRLRIGEDSLEIKNSASEVDLSKISEGILIISAEVGKRKISAQPLLKESGRLERAPESGDNYARLLAIYLSLEDRIAKCEDSLRELSDSVRGHTLFNFIEEKKG